MNTFKAYVRIIQQRPTYILIQLGIFIAMVFILNAQAPSTSSEVSDVRMFMGFYFEEGAPHAIDPLIEDLKKDNHVVYRTEGWSCSLDPAKHGWHAVYC